MTHPMSRGRPIEPKTNKWEAMLNKLHSINPIGSNYIYASNASLCERQAAGLVLLEANETDKRGAASELYFAIGNGYEDVVSQAITKAGQAHLREVSVGLGEAEGLPVPISGRIDFVAKADGSFLPHAIIELKSTGKLPDRPKPPHLAQLMTYLVMTGLRKGTLWYISRNVADYTGKIQQRVFEVEATESELMATALTMIRGSLAAQGEVIPPIPGHMKKYKCGFCPLVPYCWEGKDLPLKGEPATELNWLEITEQAEELAVKLIAMAPDLYRSRLGHLFD